MQPDERFKFFKRALTDELKKKMSTGMREVVRVYEKGDYIQEDKKMPSVKAKEVNLLPEIMVRWPVGEPFSVEPRGTFVQLFNKFWYKRAKSGDYEFAQREVHELMRASKGASGGKSGRK